MKLQQLRSFLEVARQDCNISRAAQNLFTSQPGISKQLKTLEEELGTDLFIRHGKYLSELTPAGEKIAKEARNILQRVETIGAIAQEYTAENAGSLGIATTHTQSRYILPKVIKAFIERYPDVSLHMHQGSPIQISQLAADGTADFAIATEALELFSDLVMMPCFHWNRSILVPRHHPLCQVSRLSLADIAAHPIVTYVYGFTGRSKLDEAFRKARLEPRVVFTAVDADVIKTYVRLGLGIGILASMAIEKRDEDLVSLDASHLFDYSTTSIGFRRESFLRGYMLEFMEMFAPHLTRERVEAAVQSRDRESLQAVFADLEIPLK
jgi:LysR family cys regulon transcriptional activator